MMTKLKKLIAICLVLAMVFLTACSSDTGDEEATTGDSEPVSVEEYSSSTEDVTKTETVYVNLNADGSSRLITVSDWLHADTSGVYVTDKTTLSDFSVTKGQASSSTEDGTITWQMGTSDVYYEGTTDSALPVDIDITYYLDGTEISAEDLAGQSGKVTMEITMTNNISTQVEINGETVTIYTPMVAIGGMILSYDNFTDIEVTNGLSIGGGSYEIVVLAGSPGLNDSLNLENIEISGFEDFSFPETFTISATVTDFSLSDTYYIVMPLSSFNLNIDLPKTLEDVKDILNEIDDLQVILDQIDPNQVLESFITDGTSLSEMMDILQSAVDLYDNNKELLTALTEYLTPENIETLTAFMESIDSDEMQEILSILSDVPALQTIIDSLLQLSTGLSDVMPILEGLSDALSDPDVAEQLENLPETLETMDELMDYLKENEEVLSILSQLMSSEDMDDLSQALSSITSAGEDIGDTDVSQLTGDAQELVLRMDKWLAFGYDIYTDAPDYMETSCTFIYKTDPIDAS